MSANKTEETVHEESIFYKFECNIPIPSYLVAIIAGDV